MKCPPPPASDTEAIIASGGWVVPAPVVRGNLYAQEITIDFGAMRSGFDRINAMLGDLMESFRQTSYRNWSGEVLFPEPDPRQGDEVYVYDILPGARVFVLEDVFTVDRVDMDAPLPTVWLKELPTSPLYFSEYEYIYLANETEDQP